MDSGLTYLFRLCFTRVLADLNVPKTILAQDFNLLRCHAFAFKKKKILYFYFGFMTCFLLCLVGCKKKNNNNNNRHLLHLTFTHFSPFSHAFLHFTDPGR